MTNRAAIVRKNAKDYLKRKGDSYYAQGLLEDGQDIIRALLSDMDVAYHALQLTKGDAEKNGWKYGKQSVVNKALAQIGRWK